MNILGVAPILPNSIPAKEAAGKLPRESFQLNSGETGASQKHPQAQTKPEAKNQEAPVLLPRASEEKQKVMSIFMQKMQEELGVSPEEVTYAFSQLSVEDLKLPPELTAEKVISQLGLSSEDAQLALGLYNEMLAMTAAVGLSGYLAETNQQAGVHVLSKKEAHLMKLRHSLDGMNDRFFMNGPFSGKTGFEQTGKIDQALANNQMPAQHPAIGYSADLQKNQGQPLIKDQNNIMATTAAVGAGLTAMNEAEMKSAAKDISTAAPNVYDKNISEQNGMFDITQFTETEIPLTPKMQSSIEAALSSGSEIEMAEQGTTTTVMTMADQSATDQSNDGLEQNNSGEEAFADAELAVVNQNAAKPNNSAFTIGRPQPTEAEVQGNVKEVISQAQYLAQKGGGEMKVSLNPDGLGHVQLKVKMQNGQLTVEMITSSNEAKNALEKGLGELRDSLALHKLNLDSIKIDNAKDISSQLNQQRDGQEQGFQQRFLQDFRERNQGMKRDMYEFGAPSVPRSQTRDEAANAAYNNYAQKKDASRRLDLVA